MSNSLVATIVGVLALWIVSLSTPNPNAALIIVNASPFAITLHEDCLQAHQVQSGETAYSIAQLYVNEGYETWWIPQMRRYSFIADWDRRLYPTQYICVRWKMPVLIYYDDQAPLVIWR